MANILKLLSLALGASPPAGAEPLRIDGNINQAGSHTLTRVIVIGGDAGIQFKAGTVDMAYMEYYPRTAAPGTRGAWVGFGIAGGNNWEIHNERAGGIVILSPSLQVTGGLARWGGTPPVSKPNITGSKTASLASLAAVVAQMLAAGAAEQMWTDGTT